LVFAVINKNKKIGKTKSRTVKVIFFPFGFNSIKEYLAIQAEVHRIKKKIG